MAKVVKLKSHQQREWNQNLSLLVDDNGVIVRPVSARETLVMFQMTQHVAKTKQGFSTKTPDEPSTVEARPLKLPGSNVIEIRFLIDGMRVIGGREAMKAKLLAEHGECQVRTLNGKFLAMVRDPRQVRITAQGAAVTGANGVPHADQCMCQKWPLPDGSPHPGKHHPVCGNNEKAPVEQRGSFSDRGVPQQVAEAIVPGAGMTLPIPTPVVAPGMAIPGLAAEPLNLPPAPPPPEPKVPSPDECICKQFNLPNGEKRPDGIHHPICEFKDAWESLEKQSEGKLYIVNLDTGLLMREATAEEIQQAEAAEKTGGSMVIDIGGTMYGVILEADGVHPSELVEAAREAQGTGGQATGSEPAA